MTRAFVTVLGAAVLLAGCGGSSNPGFPKVGAARQYAIAQFKSTTPLVGRPTTISFVIRQPNGRPLRRYRGGVGPHTGVFVIFVRRDLATIIRRHPPISRDGRIRASVTFTEPGPYRMVVDAYPDATGPQRNFQLFGSIRVPGAYHPQRPPHFSATQDVAGYRFTLHGRPELHAIRAVLLRFTVRDSKGRPVSFTPSNGALAHAIFFKQGSLDYFHTHVCAAGVVGCTSVIGAARVTGNSSKPGELNVGVLVPVPGRWRLFLQCRVNGRDLSAPFSLTVSP